jgi:hypothetical protein
MYSCGRDHLGSFECTIGTNESNTHQAVGNNATGPRFGDGFWVGNYLVLEWKHHSVGCESQGIDEGEELDFRFLSFRDGEVSVKACLHLSSRVLETAMG